MTRKATKATKAPIAKRRKAAGKPAAQRVATPKQPRGRPCRYTAELGRRICQRMADGESLRAVCRDAGMPSESTVRGWVLDDVQGFAAQYARARALQAERWADELLEIADDGRNDTFLDDDGNPRVDKEVVLRSRLRVDTRKWLLSKVLPKVYGDKLDVTKQQLGKDGKPVDPPAAFTVVVEG